MIGEWLWLKIGKDGFTLHSWLGLTIFCSMRKWSRYSEIMSTYEKCKTIAFYVILLVKNSILYGKVILTPSMNNK